MNFAFSKAGIGLRSRRGEQSHKRMEGRADVPPVFLIESTLGGNVKKILITLMMAFSVLSIAVPEAQAKRLGGGGSFGKQSQNVSRQSAAPAQNQAANA